MSFMEQLQDTLQDRITYTENGAAGYATAKSALVDLNFAAASLRNAGEKEMIAKFLDAYYEDKLLAVKWLFYLRDVRGGLGERRTFRVLMRYLAVSEPRLAGRLVDLIAGYGRFDDLFLFFDTPAEDKALALIREQLLSDREQMERKKPVSLCAKWMPSGNASSDRTRMLAKRIREEMEFSAREYRRLLSELRAYLNVTETYMSSGRWGEIDYGAVPSKANLLYRNAFLAHDGVRREKYLQEVRENRAEIHAGVLMPHEIVTRYTGRSGCRITMKQEDESLEALWNHLPDAVNGASDVLCVVDGSGSMLRPVGDGSTMALHVSNAMGIYFAERLKGAYQNRFLTFSSCPKYVDLSNCRTLKAKLDFALSHTDCSNTDIEATFDLILATALRHHVKQEELPAVVLVISDMEFDAAVREKDGETLFESIKGKFAGHGYCMPRLVFWNLNSRTNVIPVRENELGVGLVSGFSVNVCRMVLANEFDPFACLKAVLDSGRYLEVERRVG